MSLEGFCHRDYFLTRQLFVFQSYCTLKVYINFVGKHIWCCIHEYHLHYENGFGRDPLRQAFVPWMQKLLTKFVYQYYNHIHLLNLQRAYTWLTMYGTQHLVLFVHSYKVFSLSYFNLLTFIDSCLNCIWSKFLFPFSGW